MMVGTILFAAAAFTVTNAPSSFSTMVERTVPCPVVSEPKVGMKFDLDLPQSSDCRIEIAVGRDADGDGCLSDDESKITVEWLPLHGRFHLARLSRMGYNIGRFIKEHLL